MDLGGQPTHFFCPPLQGCLHFSTRSHVLLPSPASICQAPAYAVWAVPQLYIPQAYPPAPPAPPARPEHSEDPSVRIHPYLPFQKDLEASYDCHLVCCRFRKGNMHLGLLAPALQSGLVCLTPRLHHLGSAAAAFTSVCITP